VERKIDGRRKKRKGDNKIRKSKERRIEGKRGR
jgi:hypothetical protein